MLYKLLLVLFILLLAIAYVAWDLLRVPPASHPQPPEETAVRDTIAPNPTFTSLDNNTNHLHDFKGKVIILNFWATWCAPCVVEFPSLLELAALREEDIVLIALSVDAQRSSINPFLQKHQFEPQSENVIIAHDPGKKISQDLFQTVLYPETFIIGPDLKIVQKIAGIADWTDKDILSFIDGLTTKAPAE
jgi:thiol-disulfide isomerase/thioredoxin